MSNIRLFKIVVGAAAAFYAFAESKSLAEKHATGLATEGKTSSVRPLSDAEYKTVDFNAESFVRVPGGKADAVATPFALEFDGETTYKLAASNSVAERYLLTLIQEKATFTVEAAPAEDYPSIKWDEVITIEASAKAAKAEKDESEGDSKDQIDMGGVPGL